MNIFLLRSRQDDAASGDCPHFRQRRRPLPPPSAHTKCPCKVICFISFLCALFYPKPLYCDFFISFLCALFMCWRLVALALVAQNNLPETFCSRLFIWNRSLYLPSHILHKLFFHGLDADFDTLFSGWLASTLTKSGPVLRARLHMVHSL